MANGAGRVMRSLMAAPPLEPGETRPQDQWGPDRLGGATLEAGDTFPMRLRSRACQADLRATYDDDSVEEKRGVELCGGTGRVLFDGSGIARQPERAFVLVNRHSAAVEEAYASGTNDAEWGDDRLTGTLERGGRQEVVLQGGCEIDLRIVFGNGSAEERRGIDICATQLIVLRPDWVLADKLDRNPGPIERAPPREGSVRLRNTGPSPIVGSMWRPRARRAAPTASAPRCWARGGAGLPAARGRRLHRDPFRCLPRRAGDFPPRLQPVLRRRGGPAMMPSLKTFRAAAALLLALPLAAGPALAQQPAPPAIQAPVPQPLRGPGTRGLRRPFRRAAPDGPRRRAPAGQRPGAADPLFPVPPPGRLDPGHRPWCRGPRILLRGTAEALETAEPEPKLRDDRLPGATPVQSWHRCPAAPPGLAALHGEGVAFLSALEGLEAACGPAAPSPEACVAAVIREGDISGDGKLSVAEIARLVRGASWLLAAAEDATPETVLATGGGGLLAGVAMGRLLMESLDYDGDGKLSAAELAQDRLGFGRATGQADGRPVRMQGLQEGVALLRGVVEGLLFEQE
ncbi:hypothetical protein ACFQU7_19810 [Pseudoroseomonas wenyumeiae]